MNVFQRLYVSLATFVIGPPVISNLAFLILVVIVLFLTAKTIVNNEELRIRTLKMRRDTDPYVGLSDALLDIRASFDNDDPALMWQSSVPAHPSHIQMDASASNAYTPSDYDRDASPWPIPAFRLLAIVQSGSFQRALSSGTRPSASTYTTAPEIPISTFEQACLSCTTTLKNPTDADMCRWAFCSHADAPSYCQRIQSTGAVAEYTDCLVCYYSAQKEETLMHLTRNQGKAKVQGDFAKCIK